MNIRTEMQLISALYCLELRDLANRNANPVKIFRSK